MITTALFCMLAVSQPNDATDMGFNGAPAMRDAIEGTTDHGVQVVRDLDRWIAMLERRSADDPVLYLKIAPAEECGETNQ